jgi:hypothetical protein
LLNSGDRMVCASEQVVRACGEFDLAHSAVVRMSRPRDQVRPLQAREQIVTATEDVMAHRPGFRLGNIHASLDGARVTYNAQWSTEEDFKTTLSDPDAREHFTSVNTIASAEPHLYRVESVHHS